MITTSTIHAWRVRAGWGVGGGGWGSGKEEWRVDVYPSVGTASNHWLLSWIAYVASVSVRFKSKERGTRVKDRAKNGVSKTAGRGGEERKETLADKPRDFENRPLGSVMTEFVHRHLMLSSAVIIDQYRPNNFKLFGLFSFFPLPPPPSFMFLLSFHFSRGQSRESRSSVFLCSVAKRKRLLRRLGCEVYAWLTRPIKVSVWINCRYV